MIEIKGPEILIDPQVAGREFDGEEAASSEIEVSHPVVGRVGLGMQEERSRQQGSG